MPDAVAYDMVLSIDPLTVPAGAAKGKITAYFTVFGDATDNHQNIRLGDAFAGSAFSADDLGIA